MVTQSRDNFFYESVEIDGSQTSFPSKEQCKFDFQATGIIIVNDSKVQIDFSFRRPRLDGELYSTDGPLVLDCGGTGKVWFKLKSASSNKQYVRVWAWRK